MIEGQWQSNVLLTVGANGTWQSITPNVATSPSASKATWVSGPLIPGIVNSHGHAFQRAIAGLTEHRTNASNDTDNFWTWRDSMYKIAGRISPEQLEVIANQLFSELLRGGYTHVCEFHYLHNQNDGAPYANSLEMAMALVRAAQTSGIGLTLLPTLYMRSGFNATGLRDEQRRFASTPDSIIDMANSINSLKLPRINAGIALHSLRAVDHAPMNAITVEAKRLNLPIHIHISEQVREVSECVEHLGARPIEWLLGHADVDARWNLVHATHATPDELSALRQTGASIAICPSTEANLGDGLFDFTTWAALGGIWSIGSDSHITRSATEEMRLLEYGQRLHKKQRNVASQSMRQSSTGAALLSGAIQGGSAAAGLAIGEIKIGNFANFIELDQNAASLIGIPIERFIDAWIFSSPDAMPCNVFVQGDAAPIHSTVRNDHFRLVMQALSKV
jgi:formimidoylglutamate deiminase